MNRVLQGRYRVVREVGRGGHGSVFLCEDLRLPESRWAVKELTLQSDRVAEFEHEARILSQVDHPRIPVVVDSFTQDGRFYLVREFLQGPTLHQWVEERGPLGEAQALQWGIELAEVLAYLHGRPTPLFHRDLKPQNVVILPDGVHLMDFGLAAEVHARGGEGATGSVSFTAPEQFASDVPPAATVDIYGLGALLYYMLAGVPPSPTGGEHRLRPGRPGLDPDTEDLILECMAPDPARRPAEISAVLNALQMRLARLPPPPSWQVPAGDPAALAAPLAPILQRGRSGPGLALALALTPVLLLALGAVAVLSWRSSGTAAPPAAFAPAAVSGAGDLTPLQILTYLDEGKLAAAEGALRSLQASEPDSGLVRLLLTQLPLRKDHPDLPKVPLLLPLSGATREHVNWIMQGVALAQADEKRFVWQPVDLSQTSVLSAWQHLAPPGATPPGLVLGPFGSQNALLLAPLASAAGTVQLSIDAIDPRVAEAGALSLAFSHSERIAQLLKHAVAELGPSGVILSASDSRAMSTSAQQASDAMQTLTGKVPVHLSYDVEGDLGRVAASIRGTGARWIYLSDNQADRAARWIVALRAQGVSQPIISVFHPASHGFVSSLKDASGEVWLVAPLWQGRDSAFVERWHRAFGPGEVDWNSALGYDAGRIASLAWRPQGPAQLPDAPWTGLLGHYHLKERRFDPFEFRFQLFVVSGGAEHPGVLLGDKPPS